MAEPKAMDLKSCTIIFKDGTGTPNELELKMDDGTLQWTVARDIQVKLDRGEIDYLKEGDEVPMKIQIEGRFAAIKSSSGDLVTPFEFLTKTGGASAYLSTAAVCAADAVDIVVEFDHNCGTTVQDEIITFSDFTYEEIGGDFKDGTLSISGICNARFPTSVRTTLA
jgi:hypothetical protein